VFGTILSYVLIALYAVWVLYLCYGCIRFVYAIFQDASRSPKVYFKGFLKVTAIFFAILILGLILNTSQPVWNSLENGFQEVWYSVKDTWLVIAIKSIFKILMILLLWVMLVCACAFIGVLIAALPLAIINSFLKMVFKDTELPFFKFPPTNFKETFFFFLTISFCLTAFIWIFMKFGWVTLGSIEYSFIF